MSRSRRVAGKGCAPTDKKEGSLGTALFGPRRDRTQKDENVISLVLHVFRNLAYLTDRHTTSTSATAIEDSQLQSDLIVAFSQEGILDLLLAMSAQADSSDYAPWNMVVLDILHLLYRGLRADELMVPEKEVEQTRLRDLLDQEAKLQDRDFGLKGSRHSRFGTTIAVQSVRSDHLPRPGIPRPASHELTLHSPPERENRTGKSTSCTSSRLWPKGRKRRSTR